MLSFNMWPQITCNAICIVAHIASGWVRRIWEGCGGAREDRQVSSFSAGLQKSLAPRKITSSAKYWAVQNNEQCKETRNKIQSISTKAVAQPNVHLSDPTFNSYAMFQPNLNMCQFSSTTLQDPPICLRFLWPNRWSCMVGWGWSETSTSTLRNSSRAFEASDAAVCVGLHPSGMLLI